MEKNSDSKHIVVSGGSRGLGLGICRELLKAGYSVSSFSRSASPDVQSLEKRFGSRLFFAEVDVNSSDSISAFVRNAIQKHGPIYGLINNAAVAQEGILATLPEIEIEKMLSTNLESVIKLTRMCLRNMIKTPGGRIINISSIIGSRGYNGLSVYSATKAGLDGFSRSLARELGRRQITVNSVAPGYMETSMSSNLTTSHLNQIIRRTPLARLAKLSDVLPLILFLLSDQAQMITGQTILVDGGVSC